MSNGINMHRLSVSVCMATYNGELYIKEQIHSILTELSEFDELIIVDDCSSDNTFNMLESYAERDSRIIICQNNKNSGVIRTFEAALAQSRNDIVFLSDQDDIWKPGRIECCLNIFETNSEVSGVVVNAEIITFHDRSGISFYPINSIPSFTITSQLLKNKVIGCCFGFRRSVLDIALPFVSGMSMHDWWLGCSTLFCGQIRYISENKIYYRRHSTNASPSLRRSIPKVLMSRISDLRCFMLLMIRVVNKSLKNAK